MSTATTELGRFLTITGQRFRTGQSAPEMFSPAVDVAWHELLGTPAYEALCLETAGQPIRHVANNGHGPIAWVAAWVEEYAQRHGGFDEIEVVDLAEVGLPFMDEPNHPRLGQYTHEHTRRWSAKVSEADAFVFVMPEYNFGFNAELKNALDFLHSE
ncbi:NADPH-dependent FMN reductase, partial [Streptomyces vinaceus]|uniref:NADPH-dependent FMN reductase n=1 Tax=Streptomyces vinaceus TaxID=1960 RepID=UPI0036768685